MPGFHIRDALDAVAARHPGLISKFGGHAMAAGLSLPQANFGAFAAAFDAEVRRQLCEDDLTGRLLTDGQLSVEEFHLELARALRNAGPWGQHFPEPMFHGVFQLVQQRIVGERHLKLVLKSECGSLTLDGIAFNVDREIWPNPTVRWAELAYKLDVNEYRGQESVQLMVAHIARADRCMPADDRLAESAGIPRRNVRLLPAAAAPRVTGQQQRHAGTRNERHQRPSPCLSPVRSHLRPDHPDRRRAHPFDQGRPLDSFSRGHICPKAVALQDIQNDPDRLRHPMRRCGDEWQAISWEEAYELVAERLAEIRERHGSNAVAIYQGNPSVHNYGLTTHSNYFLGLLKTRNRFSATSVDQLPHHLTSHLMYGHGLLLPVPDIDHTDFMLILGGNPLASNGSIMTVPDVEKRLKAIRARGGKLVVVDPRRSGPPPSPINICSCAPDRTPRCCSACSTPCSRKG